MILGSSRLLDSRDCERPEWVSVNRRMAGLESLLQPFWFRPMMKITRIRRRLGYGCFTRSWEYPWALLGADLKPGMRVLDIGSGGSAFPLLLALDGFEVQSADPSLDHGAQWLDWRKRLARSLGIASGWGLPARSPNGRFKVTYVPDSIQNLRYGDGYFDRVFCLSVMEHIPEREWETCMAQMARVLVQGGRLVMTLDMGAVEANDRQYEKLLVEPTLKLSGSIDYAVPISLRDKQARHPGHGYETLGLIWDKV